MGDAPGMRLVDLQAEIRRRLGKDAAGMAGGVDEVVRTALRCWPERTMQGYALRANPRDQEVVNAVGVVWAKVRETLEARWGTDKNTAAALDKLVQPVVLEVAAIWFSSAFARAAVRGCIVEAFRASC